MGQSAYLRKVATRWQRVLAGAGYRWFSAISGVQDGSYTPKQALHDFVRTTSDTIEAWGSIVQYGADPLLPTVHIVGVEDDFVDNTPSGTAFLEEIIWDDTKLTVTTPLVHLEGAASNPLTGSAEFARLVPNSSNAPFSREEIVVTVEPKDPSTAPDRGLYAGVVSRADDDTIIAFVVVKVLPNKP